MSERNQMTSIIFDDDGFIRPDVLRRVEQEIKQFPNQDARCWLGGVVAITEMCKILGIYPDEEE